MLQMPSLERLCKLLGVVIILALFISIQIFIGIAILSIAVVPLTWVYSLIVGESYSFVIDQSNILYHLNKIGQYSILSICALATFYFVIFKIFVK